MRKTVPAVFRSSTKATGHGQECSDDDTIFDGSEPGNQFDVERSYLSAQDKAIAASFQRPSREDLDEPELKPLSAIHKAATIGKEYHSTLRHAFDAKMEALTTSINSSANTIAIGCNNSKIVLLDAHSLQCMDVIDLGRPTRAAITSVEFRPDTETSSTQNVLLVAQGSKLHHVHASTKTVLGSIDEPNNKISNLKMRHDGQVFVTAGSDRQLRVYDESSSRLLCTLDHGDDCNTTGHSNVVYGLAWSNEDPQVLVSGGWDKTVLAWDLRVARCIRSIYGPYICGDALDMQGSSILTGSWRHAQPLQLWDFASGKLLTNLPFHQPEHEACMVYAARFGTGLLGGYICAGGSGKRPCLKVFKKAGELVGTLSVTSPVHSISNSGQDKTLAVCCAAQLELVSL